MPRSPPWRRSTRCTGAHRPASIWSGSAPTPCARSWAATRFSKRCRTIWAFTRARRPIGRPGHARAHRMQRGVRLRPRRDGQLGVLRQPDAVVGPRPRRRIARGPTAAADAGAPLCTFKETARVLAGLPDPEAAAAQTPAGDATLAGLRIAKEQGMEAPDPAATPRSTAAPTIPRWRPRRRRKNPRPDRPPTCRPEPNEPETDPDATESKK